MIQTIVLSVMIREAGKRVLFPTDTPDTPEELFDDVYFASQGYKALPNRFQEVIAFFHEESVTDKYIAPQIYGMRARSTLGWIMFAIWMAWFVMGYFTLVNYSYWKQVQVSATAAGHIDRTLK